MIYMGVSKKCGKQELGFVGRGEGIAAQAVVLLRKSETALS